MPREYQNHPPGKENGLFIPTDFNMRFGNSFAAHSGLSIKKRFARDYHADMATNPDRSSHFPTIEKKYEQPMSYWFDQMKEISDWKYPEQIAYLRESYGFSQAHANALVLYSRGSATPRKYVSMDDYLKQFDTTKQETVRSIFMAMKSKYKKMEVVIVWNHPFAQIGEQYIMGVSVHLNHILLGPTRTEVLSELASELSPYVVNKKTFKVPVDWRVDKKLLAEIVGRTINS